MLEEERQSDSPPSFGYFGYVLVVLMCRRGYLQAWLFSRVELRGCWAVEELQDVQEYFLGQRVDVKAGH